MKRRLLAAMLALTMAVGMAPIGTADAYAATSLSGNEAASEDSPEAVTEPEVTEEVGESAAADPDVGNQASEEKLAAAGLTDEDEDGETADEEEPGESTDEEEPGESADEDADGESADEDEDGESADEEDAGESVEEEEEGTSETTNGPEWADEAAALVPGSPDVISLEEGGTAYYRIEVGESGSYVIGSAGSYDTYAEMYDSDGTEIDCSDDDGNGNNFLIEAELEADSVYYLAAYGFSHRAVSDVTIAAEKKLTVNCSNEGQVAAAFTEDTTLSVSVPVESDPGTLTYQWYSAETMDDWAVINGATEASYTVPANTYAGDQDSNCWYRCAVSTDIQTVNGDFTVAVTGMPVVTINCTSVGVDYDKATTLTVTANDPYGTGVEYQWYYTDCTKEDDEVHTIEGAEEASYTIDAKSYLSREMMYTCIVTMGDYIISKNCTVNVSSLTVDSPTQNAAAWGDTVTVKVNASSLYSDQPTYSWYTIDMDGSWGSKVITTTGEYSYTLTEETYRGIYVAVEDGFCSWGYTQVTPNIAGVSTYTYHLGLRSEENDDGTTTLSPQFAWYDNGEELEDDPGLTYTYSWYKYQWSMETGMKEYVRIEDASEASLTVEAEGTDIKYMCLVKATDPTGCECVPAAGSACVYADSYDTAFFNDWYMTSSAYGTWGETWTGKIYTGDGEIYEGTDVTYQWFASTGYDTENDSVTGWQRIEGANTAKYSVVLGPDTAYEYRAIACYNGSEYTYFGSCPQSTSVKVTDQTGPRVNVRYGKGTTLSVTAESMKEDAELSYQWYYYSQQTGWSDVMIQGADDAEYQVPASALNSSDTTYFVCAISDGSSVKRVYFYVYVYRTSVQIADGQYRWYADYGKDCTVSAKVIGDTTNIQYQWYLDDIRIEGQDTAKCTIPASMLPVPGSDAELRCSVQVGTGDDTTTAYDTAYLNTNATLTTEASGDVTLNYGDSTALSVKASTVSENEITYQWYQYSLEQGYTAIEGETKNVLNVKSTDTLFSNNYYRCIVSDQMMTSEENFNVVVNVRKDTGDLFFTANGKELILKADVLPSVTEDGNVTWQWMSYDEDSEEYQPIEGAVGASYAIPEDGSEEYACQITLTTDNGSKTWMEEYQIERADTLAVLCADRSVKGQSEICMSVDAVTSTNQDITYQWQIMQKDESYSVIDGADSSTLTLKAKDLVLDEDSWYYVRCVVSDGTSTVYSSISGSYDPFTIDVDGISEHYGSVYDLYHAESGDVITVNAESVLDGDISYQWYYRDDSYYDEEEGYTYRQLEDENDSSVAVKTEWMNGRTYIVLRCRISQGSFRRIITFYVYFSGSSTDGIQIDTSYQQIRAGDEDQVVLSANASSAEGKELTYSWYYRNAFGYNEDVEGTEGDTLTLDLSSLEIRFSDTYYYYVDISDGTETVTKEFVIYPKNSSYYEGAGQHVLQGQTVTLDASQAEEIPSGAGCQWYIGDNEDYSWKAISGAVSTAYTFTAEGQGTQNYECRYENDGKTVYYDVTVYVEESDTELILDQPAAVYSNRDYGINAVSFSPSETGTYTIQTLNGQTRDHYTRRLVLYRLVDGHLKLVDEVDSYSDVDGFPYYDYTKTTDTNLWMQCKLQAGEKYYVKYFGDVMNDTSLQFLIRKDTTPLYSDYTEAGPSEKAVLEVPASLISAGDTFRWYVNVDGWDFWQINGAVTQTYEASVTDTDHTKARYRCVVSKADGSSISLDYTVKFTSITVPEEARTGDVVQKFSGKAGQTTVLNAESESNQGRTLTYTWDYEVQDGMNITTDGPVLTLTMTEDFKSTSYELSCIVDDGYLTRTISYVLVDLSNAGFGRAGNEWEEYDETDPEWTASLPEGIWTYDGTAKTPEPVVVLEDGTVLKKGTDYTVDYYDNTNAGTAVVCLTGIGDYDGYSDELSFDIEAASISKAKAAAAASSYTYTGSAITPAVTATLSGNALAAGTDYTVTYSDNTNAGTAAYTVAGKGNYTGTVTGTFKITAASISKAVVTPAEGSYIYTGSAITPAVEATLGDAILAAGTDYTVSYSSNINAGTATATVTGKGNYTGTASGTFTISPASLSEAVVTPVAGEYTYTGSAITPAVTAVLAGKTLVSGTDYTVSYSNNTNVGTAAVIITGKGNYTGTAAGSFTISPASIDKAVAAAATGSVIYTGSEIKPAVTVTVGSTTLKADTDYTVVYSDNVEIGTATINVTGKGNYTGNASTTFEIIDNVIDITGAAVTPAASSYNYTGSEITPEITVTLTDGTVLSAGDYDVAYTNNTEAGTANVTVTGKGIYQGTAGNTFKINCAAPVISKVENTTTGMKVTWGCVAGAAKYRIFYKNAKGGWSKLADTTFTNYSVTKIGTKALASGTTYAYTVRCLNSAGAYVSSYDTTGKSYCYLTTVKPALSNLSTGMKLTWTKVTGAAGYKVYRKNGSSWKAVTVVKSNSTVTCTDTAVKSNNGTKYTYIVRAYYGSSVASYSANSFYRVTAPTFSSLTNSASRTMTAKWVKNSTASGYQVQYSLSSSFASGNKTVTITKNSIFTSTISSLTKGKTYYVRIRAYKTVSGTNYYSDWCAKKSVKISK